jgi:hypothetical protein
MEGFMTRPKLELCTVGLFSAICLACGFYLRSGLQRAFEANPVFNGLILTFLVVGAAAAVRQLLRIDYSARWMAKRIQSTEVAESVPFLLVPLTPLIRGNNLQTSASALSLRAMLDGVFVRLDDGRDLSRYLMNVLILLGLLGTFWGLLQTVGGIGAVIGGLSLGEGDVKRVFDTFKEGLQKPILGMGISFSASLFGLASSLILGFMDLQAGRAQNHFCAELEEILGSKESSGDSAEFSGFKLPIGSVSAPYSEAIVHVLSENLERVQRTLRQQSELRETDQANARTLQEAVVALDDHLKSLHGLMVQMVSFQKAATPLVERLTTLSSSSSVTSLEHHARSIDLSVKEFGRQLAVASEIQTEELRGELRVIARLLAGPTPGRTEVVTRPQEIS